MRSSLERMIFWVNMNNLSLTPADELMGKFVIDQEARDLLEPEEDDNLGYDGYVL